MPIYSVLSGKFNNVADRLCSDKIRQGIYIDAPQGPYANYFVLLYYWRLLDQ